MTRTQSRLAWLLGAILCIRFVHNIPYGQVLLYPLMLLETMVHEMGHGLTALLVGGRFASLHVNSDGSGLALTAVRSNWQEALVAAGGLLGPAVVAAIGLCVGRSDRGARGWLLFGSVALFASMVVFVRAGTGWLYLVPVALVLLALALKAPPAVARLSVLFLATEFCSLVFQRSDYLFTRDVIIEGRAQPSDVQLIAMSIGLPYWFWGAVIGLLSAVLLILGLRVYFRAGHS
jgi:hypothetical protein